jgi:hypothetical protein
MRITHVIKESTAKSKKRMLAEAVQPTEADLKKFFKIAGSVEFTSDGINVDGDVTSLRGPSLTELPFKFNNVTGSFDMQDYKKLKSLVNFPNQCDTIDISSNEGMETLEGGDNLVCNTFVAEYSKLKALSNAPRAKKYSFEDSEELVTTEGLPMSDIESINLRGCSNLKVIKNLTEPLGRDVSEASLLSYNPNLPLAGVVLNAGRKGRLNLKLDLGTGGKMGQLKSTLMDFNGRGVGVAMELIRSLRDKGFDGNARFR